MQTRRWLIVLALLVIVALVWNYGWRGDNSPSDANAESNNVGTPNASLTVEQNAKDHVGLKGGGSTDVEEAPALPAPVDLSKADRERDLHGVVVREDGSPVAGAALQVLHYPWRHDGLLTRRGLYGESHAGLATRSAVDGTFLIRLRKGEHVNLRVSADGLATTEYTLRLSGERARIVMQKPRVLVVNVKTPEGKPAAGLLLHVFRRGRRDTSFRRVGTTNEAGVCVFDDIPPMPRIFLDPRPQREGWGNPSWITISMEKSGTTTHDLTLPKGRTLRGRVTDATTGKAVEGAHVGMNWVLTPRTKTDADGRFVLHGWTGKGVTDVHVLAEGYGRAQIDVEQHETLDFKLVPGHRFVGRVVDADGNPIGKAQVSAIGYQSSVSSMGSTVTDAAGRFTISSLRREMTHSLTVFARGHARYFAEAVPPPTDGREVDLEDITLGPSRSLIGRVAFADGTPVGRASASLTHLPDGPRGHRYARTLHRATDDLGRFRFDDLPPSKYRLSVTPQGEAATRQDVVLKDDDEPTTVDITLEDSREVRVRVVDDAGNPVKHARLAVTGARQQAGVSTSTDIDGLAVVRVKPGTMQLQVWFGKDAPYEPHQGTKVVDQNDIEIVLKRALLTKGRVLDPGGKPVAWAHVTFRRDGQEIVQAYCDELGVFTYRTSSKEVFDVVFRGMAGSSRARLHMPTHKAIAGVAEGVEPGAQDIVVRAKAIASDRSLTVRALDPSGNAVPKVPVSLHPTSPGRKGYSRTDDKGEVTYEDLLAQPTQVRVLFSSTAEQPWRVPAPKSVVPHGQTIEVQFATGTTIEGTVFEHDGKPIRNGFVQVFHDEKQIGIAKVGPDGRYVAVVDPARSEDVQLRMYLYEKGKSRVATQRATPGTKGVEIRLPQPE